MSTTTDHATAYSNRVSLSGFETPDGRTPIFEAAEIDPERWNGFAQPSFTRVTMDLLVQIANRAGYGAGYDVGREAYFFAAEGASLEARPYDAAADYNAGDGSDAFEIIGKRNDGLFDMGGAWSWSRVGDFGDFENDPGFVRAEDLALELDRDPHLRLGDAIPREREVGRDLADG